MQDNKWSSAYLISICAYLKTVQTDYDVQILYNNFLSVLQWFENKTVEKR